MSGCCPLNKPETLSFLVWKLLQFQGHLIWTYLDNNTPPHIHTHTHCINLFFVGKDPYELMKGWQTHTCIQSLVYWCKPMFWKLKPPVKAPYCKHLWKGVFHTNTHTRSHTHTQRVLRNVNAWRTQVLYNNSPSVARLLLHSTYLWLFCCSSCQISLHILSQIMTGPLSMNYRVIQDYAIMSTLFHPCQQLMDEVWLQALHLTHWDTHRHIQVVISRSLGVLLDKGAVVVIPLAAVSLPLWADTAGFRGGEERSQEKKRSSSTEQWHEEQAFRCIH